MTKTTILNTLHEQKAYLQTHFSVDKIGLFGSYAKGEQNPQSDIDIYVEFRHKTFDNIAGLWNYLESLYHKKVDLIYWHKRANKVIMDSIQKDVIYG